MRFRAELAPGVLRDLQRNYSPEDVHDFRQRLKEVLADPINGSEMHFDPDFSGFVHRRFSFGVNIEKLAIFRLVPAGQNDVLLRVVRCQLSKPPRPRRLGDAL